MIKFFRRIRQKLITEGKLSRYILYAIGEIVLVMIGILLALQVSNWNDKGKDRIKEATYLNNIKDDLQNDIDELNTLINANYLRLSIFKLIDPDFYLRDDMIMAVDKTEFNFRGLFERGRSYRPIKGSYSSLISEGQSKLIQNRDIFGRVQAIYEVEYAHIASIYETLKDVEIDLKKKRAYEIKYPPSRSIRKLTDKGLLADLNLLHDLKGHYTRVLISQKDRISETIALLDIELRK